MLHILWMILKFILIVLGILIGLLLLALLFLLFCPVCYQGEVSGTLEEWKKAQGTVSVSWLFHGIGLRIQFREGRLVHSIRLLGIPLEKLKRISRIRSKTASGKPSSEKNSTVKQEQTKEEYSPRQLPPGDTSVQTFRKDAEESVIQSESMMEADEKKTEEKTEKSVKSGSAARIWNKITMFWDKLTKIPDYIRNFSSKAQSIYDKIDYTKDFLTHPRVKEAISFAWARLKRLLKHIFPTYLEGHVTFGSEDPSVTGTVLAALGITMPFHKNCIRIQPVFEGRNLLEGDVKLRGRIYGIVIVVTAVQIYFHKNIKYVIYRWKQSKA